MNKKDMFVSVVVIFFMMVLPALAQDYTSLAPLPGTTTGGGATTNLSAYLSGMIKLLIALGGAFSILMAIIGGTQYIAAGSLPDAKSGAKERIQNALVGLALVLSSYLILNSINPKLVKFEFMLPPVVVSPVKPDTSPRASGVHIPQPRGVNPQITNSGTSSAPVWGIGTSTEDQIKAYYKNQAQEITNARIDRTNDFSIISHCVGNTTYDLCPKTDMNKDGKTDITDITFFVGQGNVLDVSQDKTLELADSTPSSAQSCFFRTSTINVRNILPAIVIDSEGAAREVCGGGVGFTISPTVKCNGSTWLKYQVLNGVCAVDAGSLTMPFGFVYQANGTYPGDAGSAGQYSNFSIWVKSASSGSSVSLPLLFNKTFMNLPQPPCGDSCGMHDPYYESALGKITYATVAQHDLNDDGTADFGSGGADMSAFSACKGSPVSGACAKADFNNDGVISDKDLGFVTFINRDVLGAITALPLGGKLDWFESMMFDPAGYKDKQIINYCLGRTAWEKCGPADINNDNIVNSTDLSEFNTNAPVLDFNGDGIVNLTDGGSGQVTP